MRRSNRPTWSVVLAGGEGERTRPFIERWLGRHRPKQYCTFVGTRSLLQHTIDRADRLSRPDHRVTVVARGHRRDALPQLGGRGRVVFQPANRGTAPGVFLPLTFVRAADPDATVVIYPSDHFVWPEPRFVGAVARAISESEACPERPILLGVTPDGPETDYGWIVTEPPDANAAPDAARRVSAFREKPGVAEAATLMAGGGLWNTLITVARVETLWQMGRRWLPDVVLRFEELHAHIGSRHADAALDAIYTDMPRHNFSSGLLEPAAARLAARELDDVMWSDWGRPERIVDTLAAIGRAPAFGHDPGGQPRPAIQEAAGA
jgi:mannose-1-phosphate guanylyltransferase